MVEKIVSYALVCHFLVTIFAVMGALSIRRHLKKPISLSVTPKGLWGGAGVVLLALVLIGIAKLIGWDYIVQTLVALAVPYTLLSIFLTSNAMTYKTIQKDSEEIQK
jgi:hypothetical protein